MFKLLSLCFTAQAVWTQRRLQCLWTVHTSQRDGDEGAGQRLPPEGERCCIVSGQTLTLWETLCGNTGGLTVSVCGPFSKGLASDWEATLLGLVVVSDWTLWGVFDPDQRKLGQHCNNTIITEKDPATAVLFSDGETQSDTLTPYSTVL